MNAKRTLLFLVIILISNCICDDYYKLLGIKRDANDKEIRKAFKKLALSLHPDKNIGDENANEKFIKINRAYEVLKDSELRKKYDMHGEEGLDESKNQNWGHNFHSWNYYQNDFGIYDDDSEIITLSYSDFEQSVKASPDTWFINFYSPQCSHCHTLAPVWRQVAVELEGIVRIGAVNCGEDWRLCHQQNIHSYPSLLLYPEGLKYQGERSFDDIVSFILKRIPSHVIILKDDNYKKWLTSAQPWLIFFCDYSDDCMDPKNKRKLAAAFNEMVNVADIDCTKNPKVCKHFNKKIGSYYFDDVEKVSEGLEIDSFDTQSIISTILELQPGAQILKENEFKDLISNLESLNEAPWLIHFSEEEQSGDLEFKKIPTLLPHMRHGRVDCRIMRTMCNFYHVHKFPTFAVFKTGGSYEIYHGRLNSHDIAVFARESATSLVKTLQPNDFPLVTSDDQPYFIDFYAPWCPPCQQLLPEWRKAAKLGKDYANFGTVDCTIHASLCNKYNIQSYPTTILYNRSLPHQYHGHKTAYNLVEFMKDIISPNVIDLDNKLFDLKVRRKKLNEIWLIDFFSPWCGPCQQLSPEWRKLAKVMKNNSDVHVAQVDCTAHSQLCQDEGIRSYPNIRLYPMDKQGSSSFSVYSGWNRDANSIRSWLYQYLPSNVKNIENNYFTNVILNDEEPWLIDFYAPWCGHCQTFSPVFESLAEGLQDKVKFGKVNCDQQQQTCQFADVEAYPTVKFYSGSKGGKSQNMWGEEIQNLNFEHISSFINTKLSQLNSQVKDEL